MALPSPLFQFERDRITSLGRDEYGHVMAYRNTAEGDALVDESSTWQQAPDPIAGAAVEWWEDWRRSHP